jgi:hypothetical protein
MTSGIIDAGTGVSFMRDGGLSDAGSHDAGRE